MRANQAFVIHFSLFVLLLITGWVSLFRTPPVMDEVHHLEQIFRFVREDYRLYERLEMIPSLHFAYAICSRVFRRTGLNFFRFLTVCSSSLLFVVLWCLCPKKQVQKVWQSALLPAVSPFLFLVYTDVPALLFLLFAFLAGQRRRPVIACISLSLACLIRQNHLAWFPWVIFVCIDAQTRESEHTSWIGIVKGYWYFLFSCSCFLCYFLVHGGVSLHLPPGVENISFHAGNIIFLFVLFPILFLPLLFERASDLVRCLKTLPGLAALLGGTMGSFFTFHATHPFNRFVGHLRTYLFLAVEGDFVTRMGFSLLAGIGVVFLISGIIERRTFVALSLSSMLALFPLKLVEIRYLFPSLLFFILLKKEGSSSWGRAQIIHEGLLSLFLFVGCVNDLWFW